MRSAAAALLLAVVGAACGGASTAPAAAPTTPPPAGATLAPATAPAPTAPTAPTADLQDWPRLPVDATWQWQLSGEVNTTYDADVYDVDLFDAPDAMVAALHGAGRIVICYFSAGSHEDWRIDAGSFPVQAIGRSLGDWPGERWLDIRSSGVFAVLVTRLDLARERGCDGVEPDNVDGFANDTGFPLTERDQLAFNRALADAAHARGLAIGLKNAPELIPALIDAYDFAVTEQCHEQGWCEETAAFAAAGKPVFDAEYADNEADARALADDVCPEADRLGIATLLLPLALDDAFRLACVAGG